MIFSSYDREDYQNHVKKSNGYKAVIMGVGGGKGKNSKKHMVLGPVFC